MLRFHRLLAFAALAVCTSLSPRVPAQPQLVQQFTVIDRTFKSCPLAVPDRTVAALDLTKPEGAGQAWQGSLAPAPPVQTKPIYYGPSDASCPEMWVTDFTVNASTTGKWPDASPVTKVLPWSQIGDISRSGLFESALTSSSLLTKAQQSACSTPPHAFQGKNYATEGACNSVIAVDICSKLLQRMVIMWKKHGTTNRVVTQTLMRGFLWDGNTCSASSRFSFNIFDPPYVPVANDGYRTLPVPGGATDEYRVASQALIMSKPITDHSSNAAMNGKSTPDAMFLFNPVAYPPSTNPVAQELPVRNVLQPTH